MAKKNFKKGVKNVIDSIEKVEATHQKHSDENHEEVSSNAASASKSFIVELGGTFTVSNVKQAKTMLTEVASGHAELTIKSAPVTDVDVSFIQLLTAFDKMAVERGILVHWAIVLTSEISQLLRNTNMHRTIEPFLKMDV